jgi:tetratricopeptide (TPR) repeat protein
MVRIVLSGALIVSLISLIGCYGPDTGRAQILAPQTPASAVSARPVNIAEAVEADLIEEVATSRQAYRRGLELLIHYYGRKGDNKKLGWAEKELTALDRMPQYKYIIDGVVAGSNLRATTSIPVADQLFYEAQNLEKEAGPLPVLKNEDILRLALDKYNQLIREHPASDKIDDAAFQAALIYDHFKDYSIALLYYQRAYEWDPETPYPARFRAAAILDRHLRRRAEALKLYQEAVKKEARHEEWKEFAERRIRELTKTEESGP